MKKILVTSAFLLLSMISAAYAVVPFDYFDQCDNNIGWISNPGGCATGYTDCCWGWQDWHVHDLGSEINAHDVSLTVTYSGGNTQGCTDRGLVSISSDGQNWEYIGATDYSTAWVRTSKTFNLLGKEFRYVKVDNEGSCYTDYSDAGVRINNQVPEFTAIGAGLALLGAGAVYMLKRRNIRRKLK